MGDIVLCGYNIEFHLLILILNITLRKYIM